jgi:hypothetical protein
MGLHDLLQGKLHLYERLAEMPGVARVDHRTKCVSLVAISLSQNFETRNCWSALPSNSPRTDPNENATFAHQRVLGTDPKEKVTPLLCPRTDPKENVPAA